MFDLQIKDTDDELVKQLKLLNRQLAAQSGGKSVTVNEGDTTIKEGDTTVNQGDTIRNIDLSSPNDETTANYFSTGASPLVLDSADGWEKLPIGILAAQISIRFDQDIEVAFRNPNDRTSAIIGLRSTESPFSIGSGDLPIATAWIWMRKSDSSDPDANIQVIARK